MRLKWLKVMVRMAVSARNEAGVSGAKAFWHMTDAWVTTATRDICRPYRALAFLWVVFPGLTPWAKYAAPLGLKPA